MAMKDITSFQELTDDIRGSKMLLAYFSGPDCGVCTALKPKVLEILDDYPEIESRYINVRDQQEAAAQHNIFTIPGILVFTEGRESIREARFVHVDELRNKIDRLHSMLFR
jgi:thiol-disulfide isomerase/thioredoxin